MKTLFLPIIAVILASCATVPQYTPAESAYLDSLRVRFRPPITAVVPIPQEAAAWSRALEFATKYGEPIESANESLIATKPARLSWFFTATKIAAGDSVRIMVRAGNRSPFDNSAHVATVARMYAAYIETGELPFPNLFYK